MNLSINDIQKSSYVIKPKIYLLESIWAHQFILSLLLLLLVWCFSVLFCSVLGHCEHKVSHSNARFIGMIGKNTNELYGISFAQRKREIWLGHFSNRNEHFSDSADLKAYIPYIFMHSNGRDNETKIVNVVVSKGHTKTSARTQKSDYFCGY